MDENVLDIFLSPFLRIYNIYNIDDLFFTPRKGTCCNTCPFPTSPFLTLLPISDSKG